MTGNQSCLALNASFEPMTLMGLEDAVRLVYQGKAEMVAQDGDKVLHSPSTTMPKPAVIRLKKFIKVPQKFRKKVTNTFLFARDEYRCQYCGRSEKELGRYRGHKEVLNRDHIVPQSRGGENSWTNCVASCSTCNGKKDNKTPAEAGMELLTTPTEPHLVHLKWTVRRLTPIQRKYVELFYGEEIAKLLK